ncbi:GNAT family N-acetyltransferase [Sinorhizobium meliloti]|uniref:GNAT family N-acetyltransferase n=1 Tax=Rhizobium meliloti TaxID=382 RepID=UPI0013E360B5|nr:GNAT family N-acetyltransferase [Sinorhizobium meliloti]
MQDDSLVTCPPSECPKDIIARFVELICQGGAIPGDPVKVENRLRNAKALVYLPRGEEIIGIAALKSPVESYRARIGESAGFPIPEKDYPYELGYVVVDASMQGQNLSPKLVNAIVALAAGERLFATTSSAAMHKVLPRAGFVKGGQEYKNDNGETLTLYVR